MGERTGNKALKLTRSAMSKLPRPSQLIPVLGAHLGVGRERTDTTKVPQRGILAMRGNGRVHWLRVGSRASRLLRARPRAAPPCLQPR